MYRTCKKRRTQSHKVSYHRHCHMRQACRKRSYCLDCTSIDWSTTRYLHHCPNSAGNKDALSSNTLKSTRTSCRDLNKKLFCSSGELMKLDNNFWRRKSVHHANQPKGGLSYIKNNLWCSIILPAVHQSGAGFCPSTCLQRTCAIPLFATQMPKPQSTTPNFLLLEMLF